MPTFVNQRCHMARLLGCTCMGVAQWAKMGAKFSFQDWSWTTEDAPPLVLAWARLWFMGQECGNTGSQCLDNPVLPRSSTMEHMLQT